MIRGINDSSVLKGGRPSEFGFHSSLLAEFVCCDSIELSVAFDWYSFLSISVNSVICTFTENIETMLLQVSDEITPFDRHAVPQWTVAQ